MVNTKTHDWQSLLTECTPFLRNTALLYLGELVDTFPITLGRGHLTQEQKVQMGSEYSQGKVTLWVSPDERSSVEVNVDMQHASAMGKSTDGRHCKLIAPSSAAWGDGQWAWAWIPRTQEKQSMVVISTISALLQEDERKTLKSPQEHMGQFS